MNMDTDQLTSLLDLLIYLSTDSDSVAPDMASLTSEYIAKRVEILGSKQSSSADASLISVDA
ncbi:MAG: hypothetical protein JXA41_00830 [Deltaproteobacteria bacterium]|nr:hypothetical protein [Deltaproteobacteria bacterium]